jgi:hypothetical protein
MTNEKIDIQDLFRPIEWYQDKESYYENYWNTAKNKKENTI